MPYRVVVWGPGNVGAPALRTVIANPELELAGVIVHSESKQGRDAGDLVGLAATGVIATRDPKAALASIPDAIFYGANQDFRPQQAMDDMLAALESGINVLTAGTYGLLHPATADPVMRGRFEKACTAGDSSFLSSGIDPGFAMDLLPMVLSGVCEEIHEIRIIENFNYASYDVPDSVRAIIGFGMPLDQTPAMLTPGIPQSVWGGSLNALADALGLVVEELREVIERIPLERDVEVAGARLERGTQGAFRFEVQAIVDGRPTLVVEHVTRIVDDAAPQWPKPEGQGHHQVRISGRPNIKLTIESEDEHGDHVAGGNATAAARLVNAIPWVCRAPAGLLSGIELPLIVGRGLVKTR